MGIRTIVKRVQGKSKTLSIWALAQGDESVVALQVDQIIRWDLVAKKFVNGDRKWTSTCSSHSWKDQEGLLTTGQRTNSVRMQLWLMTHGTRGLYARHFRVTSFNPQNSPI
jgi:hypothetical protein